METSSITTQTTSAMNVESPENNDYSEDLEKFIFDTIESISFPTDYSPNINEIVDHYSKYFRETEWIFTLNDLKLIIPYSDAWNKLAIPVRLRIAMYESLSSSMNLTENIPVFPPPSPAILSNSNSTRSSVWQHVWDEPTQSYYYYNRDTGQTSWNIPDMSVSVEDSSVANEMEPGHNSSNINTQDIQLPDHVPWKRLCFSSNTYESNSAMFTKLGNRIYLKGSVTVKENSSSLGFCSMIPPEFYPRINLFFCVDIFQLANSCDNSNESSALIFPGDESAFICVDNISRELRLLKPVPSGFSFSLACINWQIGIENENSWEKLPLNESFHSIQYINPDMIPKYSKEGDICMLSGIVTMKNASGKSFEAWTSLTSPIPTEYCPPRSFHGEVTGWVSDHADGDLNDIVHSQKKISIKVAIYAVTRQLQIRECVPNGTLILLDGLRWSCSNAEWIDLQSLPPGFICPPDSSEQCPQYRIEPLDNNHNLISFRGSIYLNEEREPLPLPILSTISEPDIGQVWPDKPICCMIDCITDRDLRKTKLRISSQAPHLFIGCSLKVRDILNLDSINYLQDK